MTLDDVMKLAWETMDAYADHIEDPKAPGWITTAAPLRAAILAYGRAERERAAKFCDELAMSSQALADELGLGDQMHQLHFGTSYGAAVCASAIRALPDSPFPVTRKAA